MAQSTVSHIINYPTEPVALFKQLIEAIRKQSNENVTYMNLATIDSEFGVLNRTVVYRGLSEDNCIIYITQRFTRNYKNIQANAKCGITFFLPNVLLASQSNSNRNPNPHPHPQPDTWQVRLIGATAEELPESQLDEWWNQELLSAQIRNLIFPCGQPVNYEEQVEKHNRFLREHLESKQPLKRPATYTAFKFRAQRWDFLKVGSGEIADRVQYRRQQNGEWQSMHVST